MTTKIRKQKITIILQKSEQWLLTYHSESERRTHHLCQQFSIDCQQNLIKRQNRDDFCSRDVTRTLHCSAASYHNHTIGAATMDFVTNFFGWSRQDKVLEEVSLRGIATHIQKLNGESQDCMKSW